MDGALTTKDLDQAVSASQRAHDPYGGGFRDGNGEDVRPPDRVEYEFGARRGWLAVVFQDGDAYVRFDGDEGDTLVKWRSLCKVPAWADDPGAAAGCPFDKAGTAPKAGTVPAGEARDDHSAGPGTDAGGSLKTGLATRIRVAARERGLTLAGAAATMGVTEADASDVMAGFPDGIPAERLVTLLNRLGVSVLVSFRQEPGFAPGATTFGWDHPTARGDDGTATGPRDG